MLELFIKFAISVCIIIIVARIIGGLMPYIKQPRVIGEMIAGVVLGPTLFGALFPDFSTSIFTKEIIPILFIISNLGLSIYIFLVGMELDINIHDIAPKTFKSSVYITVAAMLPPFIGVIPLIYLFQDKLSGGAEISQFAMIIFFGTALAITAFPMLARILEEKNIVKTKLGEIMLLSASLQDVLSWILLSFITSIAIHGKAINGIYTFIGAIIFVLLIHFIVKPILNKISNSTSQEKSLSQNSFAIIFILLIVCAIITDKIGLYSVFGGFVLGLYMPRNQKLISEIKIRLYDILVVFFLPIFFTFSGLQTDLSQIVSSEYLIPCLIILGSGVILKIIPIFTTMKLIGYSNKTSVAVSGLMNARGLMELIIANIGLTYGFINNEAYSILVLLAVLSTLAASPIFEYSAKNEQDFNPTRT